MSLIKPITALRDDGDLAPTLAKFPGIQHCLKFTEAVGATSLADSIGGMNLSSSGGAVVATLENDGITLNNLINTYASTFKAVTTSTTRLIFKYTMADTGTPSLLRITADGNAATDTNIGYSRTTAGIWVVSSGGGAVGDSATITTTTHAAKDAFEILSFTPNDATGLRARLYDGTTLTSPADVATNALAVVSAIPAITFGAVNIFTGTYAPGYLAVIDVAVKPSAGQLSWMCEWMWSSMKVNFARVLPPNLLGQ